MVIRAVTEVVILRRLSFLQRRGEQVQSGEGLPVSWLEDMEWGSDLQQREGTLLGELIRRHIDSRNTFELLEEHSLRSWISQ